MTSDATLSEAAPAKINLALHVTGQRDDGYHLLDSLVVFAQIGDTISVARSDVLSLSVDGPFADGLSITDNLVLDAARAFDTRDGAAITLTKRLPLASGIGGGSADAAATLRALSRLWDRPLPQGEAIAALGADVPVCLSQDLTRMSGIGDDLHRIGPPPPLHLLLVNPGVEVSTPAGFKALPQKSNPPMTDPMPHPWESGLWLDWLRAQRNDLQAPACEVAPVISDVLDLIAAQTGCDLARMSGSGATCFGLFQTAAACTAAQAVIAAQHPEWWCVATQAVT
ncbi:4-(cytidine 5'-diphospho)-2-C-methyl-D-erythritol kinase [Thalassorhabdomicrobium marinisediminis]|uniref:4-diphosphocytidyl-2-C-methyl-D-erythritol kinase n=1 Tax=Thalassorhabdomicrobium marinisediminis TaxID=2170577 RepID=A0A2T7FYW4_9RHOB|nr:4-(cytidine 5'-diphospho)-2-C-methyl-D-erythritol kinase [Thalassorhabdomicrobium marinisediminis]PVA07357.1 4-(cytidine 5'-diphospho)-2-C-methyl-D-erythritol kinase [Thalassorhabdomicrobium marinisediminis]